MSTSASLDCHSFYELTDPLASRPLRLSDEGYDEWLTSEYVFALANGRLKLDQPLSLGAYMGGEATDFLWSGFVSLVCISSRVAELLTENKVIGWTTYPVEVHNRKGVLLPDYYGFAVTGSECERDRSRSEIIDKPPPTPMGKGYQVYKGLYFYEQQWDGSDMFWIHNSGIVVTKRVCDLLKKNNISNVRLVPLTEVEIDVKLDEYDRS